MASVVTDPAQEPAPQQPLPALFRPLMIGQVTIPNRIAVSPMCQYSSDDGFASDWHLVHLGSRAVGGAGLVFTEATAVEARGRISPQDLGIWKDEHVPMLRRITDFIWSEGAVPGIQLAHAGRKASTARPWEGGRQIPTERGGWSSVAPSALAFRPEETPPSELTLSDIEAIVTAFVEAAGRAAAAQFGVIEIHAAHGYLIHEFLSPLSNHRQDAYGGSFENRIRLLTQIVQFTRMVWPVGRPLLVRISATDWVPGGWTAEDSVALAAKLGELGVDLVDCSSGGNALAAQIPVGPGYQVPFASRIRHETGMRTGAVGVITEPGQANTIIENGDADMVLLAREMLRDPYWPLHAARALGYRPPVSTQYTRAF